METATDIALEYAELRKVNQKQAAEIAKLKAKLSELKRLIFGSKTERFISDANSNQASLFDLGSEPMAEVEYLDVSYQRKKQKNKPVRTQLPAHLPRTEEITEQLEYAPGKVYVKKIIRPKYALPRKEGIVIAEMPSLTLPKSMAGSSLLAYLLVSKFVDHLPFYRQVQIFKREGLSLSESTVNGWLKAVCELLEPLYEKLKEELLNQDYLQADKSSIKRQARINTYRLSLGLSLTRK